MGIWASPFKVETAKQFAAILESEHKILPEHAMDRIGMIVGDDRLYDEADHRAKLENKEAWVDFRNHAVTWVAGWLSEGNTFRWREKWEEEAVDICNAAIDRWMESHEPPTWLTLEIEQQFESDPEIGRRPAPFDLD